MKVGCLVGFFGAIGIVSSVAAPFTVVNTSDSGTGSLRQAILNANGNTGADTIGFNIPASDPNCDPTTHVCTVTLASSLPAITDPVTIDGYTQPGTSVNTQANSDNAVLRIEINGNGKDGFVITGGSSTIRGLVINRCGGVSFTDAGITLRSGNNVIEGNFIGTDPTGETAEPNVFSGGVLVSTGASNLIGG